MCCQCFLSLKLLDLSGSTASDLLYRTFLLQDVFCPVNHEYMLVRLYMEGYECPLITMAINTSRPRQDGRLFEEDIFKHIFFNENVKKLIQI